MGLEMSQPGLDHSALVEEVKETTALVILALGSMMHISEEQASKRPHPPDVYSICLSPRLCMGSPHGDRSEGWCTVRMSAVFAVGFEI